MNSEAQTITEGAWYEQATSKWSDAHIFTIEGIRNRIRAGVRLAGLGADDLSPVQDAASIVGSVEALVTLKAEKDADIDTYNGHLLTIAETYYEGTL